MAIPVTIIPFVMQAYSCLIKSVQSYQKRGIVMSIKYSETLHDREIRYV